MILETSDMTLHSEINNDLIQFVGTNFNQLKEGYDMVSETLEHNNKLSVGNLKLN